MKLAAFQPYFLPYIGYFKLIASVDMFVVLDDVAYRKKGYINRNSILSPTGDEKFVIPVGNASQNRKINEHYYISDGGLIKKIEQYYSSAPYQAYWLERIRKLMDASINRQKSVADVNYELIVLVFKALGITKNIIFSSHLAIESNGEKRIIEICEKVGATQYLNPIGGFNIYSKDSFHQHNIELHFVNYENELRRLVCKNSNLSILHHLLNPVDSEISDFLRGSYVN